MVERELTFDAVLAAVQGLIGQSVIVEIENPYADGCPLNVVGKLNADHGMTEPYDDDEFDFAIGDAGAMTLNRSQFLGASPVDAGGVHVTVGKPENSIVLRIEPFQPAA